MKEKVQIVERNDRRQPHIPYYNVDLSKIILNKVQLETNDEILLTIKKVIRIGLQKLDGAVVLILDDVLMPLT